MLTLGLEATDPLNGDYPQVTTAETIGLAPRMRGILQGRSRDDLDRMLTQVNIMLESPELQKAIAHDFAIEHDLGNDEAPEAPARYLSASEARPLLACLDIFEPIESWAELFATFSLALLNEAVVTERQYSIELTNEDSDSEHNWRMLFNVTPWTSAALEAGAYAEALNVGSPFGTIQTKPVSSKISLHSQKGGIARHGPTHKAIRALRDFYLAGNHPSYAEATKRFCKAYPAVVKHLSDDNRHRTLKEGLSRILKSSAGRN